MFIIIDYTNKSFSETSNNGTTMNQEIQQILTVHHVVINLVMFMVGFMNQQIVIIG